MPVIGYSDNYFRHFAEEAKSQNDARIGVLAGAAQQTPTVIGSHTPGFEVLAIPIIARDKSSALRIAGLYGIDLSDPTQRRTAAMYAGRERTRRQLYAIEVAN